MSTLSTPRRRLEGISSSIVSGWCGIANNEDYLATVLYLDERNEQQLENNERSYVRCQFQHSWFPICFIHNLRYECLDFFGTSLAASLTKMKLIKCVFVGTISSKIAVAIFTYIPDSVFFKQEFKKKYLSLIMQSIPYLQKQERT